MIHNPSIPWEHYIKAIIISGFINNVEQHIKNIEYSLVAKYSNIKLYWQEGRTSQSFIKIFV